MERLKYLPSEGFGNYGRGLPVVVSQCRIRAGNLDILQPEGGGPFQNGVELFLCWLCFGQNFGRD